MPRIRALFVCAAVGLLPAAVDAEVNTSVIWQVSPDNQSWGSSLAAAPGGTVYARAVLSYTGTAQPLGLAATVFQPIVSNWSLEHTLLPFVNGGVGGNTSTPLGVVTNPDDPGSFGRLSPWGKVSFTQTSFIRGHVHTNGSGGAPQGTWLRIAQNQTTAWIGGAGNTSGGGGVHIAQLSNVGRTTLDPAFNGQLAGIVVFKFAFVLGASAQSMTISSEFRYRPKFPPAETEDVYWFGSMSEATGSIRGDGVVTPATIFIPAPGALICLATAACMTRRRRP